MNPNVWQRNPNFRPRFTIKSCFHRSSQLQSSSTKLTSIYRQNRSVFFPNIYLSIYIYIYIVLNHPSPGQEQKRFYSRVLQGHLALATAVFPEGTCGLRLGKPWVKLRTNAEKNMVKKWQTWWSRGVCLLLSWMGFHCLTCLFTIFAENHG